ncbi:MAG TPA: arsenate reductase (azurin) small subunit [Azospirillaceae bacterium]|nr:arsenate reductase (azurin) small subunit [Azospirillaceae bacterium]
MSHRSDSPCNGSGFVSRRQFLIFGGTGLAVVGTLAASQTALAQAAQLVMSRYPEKRIATLKDLAAKKPLTFHYPNDTVENVLVMLGEPAGGGIGPGRDIVAFNTVCPHMGGYIGPDGYKADHNVLGPCPLHLTTFDLTKHGMVVSGHATESLPQIVLEERAGAIYAVGVMGLFYGYSANPVA